MPKKIIHKVVENCGECLYCHYNDYSNSIDSGSGYDCWYDDNEEKRIITYFQWEDYCKELREWTKSQKTLFPIPECEKPENPFKIPVWCPLPNHNEDDLK